MGDSARSDRPIRVGIGLIQAGGRYLIRRRPEGTAMAGCWEFPGGKCEPGEPPAKAAIRECREETGLDVLIERRRALITHRYEHAWVELHYFDAAVDPGSPPADPGSGFVWVEAGELPGLTFPEANAPILAALAEEAARDDARG